MQKEEEEERKMQLHMKQHNVPNDIIVEILLRLPAKSLLRLRWACKYWFNLITRDDDDFIKMHLLHGSTITNHDDISSSIILDIRHKNGDDDDVGYQIIQCSLDYNDTTRVVNISSEVCIDLPSLGHRPQIMGSCNGLILLDQSPSLYVWNPCTKEYRLLPHPLKLEVSNLLFEGKDNYGLGYDRTTDDYKVIKTTYYHPKNQECFSHVQVYTFGTNKWRSIKPYLNTRLWGGGVFVNGALYWIDNNSDTISFNIGKEEFQHVSNSPTRIANYVCNNFRWLQEFEGSLCIVLLSKDEQKLYWDMWVMKDYALNHNSLWFKLSSIECLCEFVSPLKPLRFTRNGEILMVRLNGDLVLHDPKSNKEFFLCKICEQPSFLKNLFGKVYYTESLVSLYSGTYTGQEQRKRLRWL